MSPVLEALLDLGKGEQDLQTVVNAYERYLDDDDSFVDFLPDDELLEFFEEHKDELDMILNGNHAEYNEANNNIEKKEKNEEEEENDHTDESGDEEEEIKPKGSQNDNRKLTKAERKKIREEALREDAEKKKRDKMDKKAKKGSKSAAKPGLFARFGKTITGDKKAKKHVVLDEEALGGSRVGQDFFDLLGPFTCIVGSSEGWLMIEGFLKTNAARKIVACLIFEVKPSKLLVTGETKPKKGQKQNPRKQVHARLAKYLPMLDDSVFEDMDEASQKDMMLKRDLWRDEFKKLNKSMVTRIGLLAQEFEISWCTDVAKYNEKFGGKPSVRTMPSSVGTPKTIEIFKHNQKKLNAAKAIWDTKKFRAIFEKAE